MEAKGHFDLSLFQESKYQDRDFEEAIKRGELDHLLLDVGQQQKAGGDNMLFDNLVQCLFWWTGWSGCPQPSDVNWYSDLGGGQAGLHYVYLATYDPETTYQEQWVCKLSSTNLSDSYYSVNSSSAAKRFIQDQIAPAEMWCHTDGVKQQIFFRNRWLYLPTQGYSNNIRSVVIVWTAACSVDNTWNGNVPLIGRVRLKDEAGEPVRINKTAYQAMLMEYTFSFVTV